LYGTIKTEGHLFQAWVTLSYFGYPLYTLVFLLTKTLHKII